MEIVTENHTRTRYSNRAVKGRLPDLYLAIILDSYSSVTAMLNQLDWQSLERRRDNSILVMFHKIINKYVDIPCDHILIKFPVSPVVATRNSYTYPQELILSCSYSFFPRVIRLWNHLPDHLVETDNIDNFKSLLVT